MNKIYVSFVSLAVLFLIGAGGTVLAQEEAAVIAPEETITTEDLGISDPGVLPTSPFYFFKQIGRGLQGLVTFNPIAKAELELKFANEKAAEIKKMSETQPQNTEAIQKALENYQVSQERLRVKFEKISETSQNPKVDTLLNNLTDRVVKHEKLFDEISFKFKEEGISRAITDTMAGSENVIGEASKKDDAAKFSSRLEKVLLEEKGGELKHARSVEIIDRFSGKASEKVKESLERLREEFSKKLESDIKDLVEKDGDADLREKITNTPGDFGKRSVIIEEIQKRADERLAQALEKAREPLEKLIRKEADIAKKAEEQIRRAEEIIQEAEKKISETDSAKSSAVVSTLLGEAKDHLANAKDAFNEEKYGEAFGQARSAEVLARNSLKFFREEKPETENLEQHLKELEEKIHSYRNMLKERGYTEEDNKDAYELLNSAVTHLGYAKEAFTKGNLENTKLHIGHVKGFLAKLARILEGKFPEISIRAEQIQRPASTVADCETITKRIIELKEFLASERIKESDFKTKYDAHIRDLVVCQRGKNAPAPLPPTTISPAPTTPVTSTQTACTLEYNPVCGSDRKTYSNACFAKSAGVTFLYRDECKIEKIETKIETETEKLEVVKPIEPVITSAVSEIRVVGAEYSFSPESIALKAGEKVKIIFKNGGSAPHNLTLEGLNIRTSTIGGGQTDTIEFTSPKSGTYAFFCSVSGHRAAGMEGKLRVE